jgi:para-aminobenzoate synthetase component I
MIDLRSIMNPVAVAAAIPLDLPADPAVVAAGLAGADEFAFLDSGQAGEAYSILAWEPELVFRSKNQDAKIRWKGHWRSMSGNPFDLLEHLLRCRQIRREGSERLPFYGGAIGYFSYDLFRHLENYSNLCALDDLNLPDCCLAFYDSALVFDHKIGKWFLAAATGFAGRSDIASLLNEKKKRLLFLLDQNKNSPMPHAIPSLASSRRSNFTRDEYLRAVERALEYIYAGDIYQVNLSQRFHQKIASTPFEIFNTLREINPSQYGAFLPYDGHCVISSSPELFLRTEGRMVETRPIKGTRPRGATPTEDLRLRRELEDSGKDKAELSMIVDLQRNDLGRVCEYGSIVVDRHAYIEPLPTVFHTVSNVQGIMREEVGPVELLRAAFPCGSISGCPKIRSIEIIDELEPTCRNVYTGSLGFIDFSGDMTLNVAIRTMIAKGRDVYFQVGGGIVADSDPQAEYDETLDKAAAMIRALEKVGKAHE